MRETHLDDNQDLTIFTQEVEDVVREIMEDTSFKVQQHFRFQKKLDDNSCQIVPAVVQRKASAGVSFQIGKLRYV